MPVAKNRTALWSGQTLTAGAGDTNSPWIDLTGAYAAVVDMILTNGAAGPTVPAQIQVQIAADYNGGSPSQVTKLGGPCMGTSTNNDIQHFVVELPAAAAAVRLVAGSNTGQNVTVDADLSRITAL